MPVEVFEEMKRFVGFDERDADNLRLLGPTVRPCFPQVVNRFYAEILRHPGAASVFSGPEQVNRLQIKLTTWLDSLFRGTYDDQYCREHSEIGRVHVRVQLPQHYMFTGMEVVWQELEKAVLASGIPNAQAKLRSLHKLLTVELGIMLETYRERYSEAVRQVERDAVHERLTRAEHLAQIGQLAASLAHEIKNPLAGISGAIQVLQDEMPQDDERRPVLGEVLHQINRLDGTVRDLLAYARPSQPNLVECDLNQVVERVLAVLAGEPEMQRVRVQRTADGPPPSILADEHQLEQLLLNLLLNAAQASPDGGVVRIEISFNSRFAALGVSDEGPGMEAEVCRRAVEPFFTTKARGTGLGLPICQKIAEAHGGTISIESAPGRGTRVVVHLPREKRAAQLRLDNESG